MNTEKICCECGDDFSGQDALCGKCPKEMDFCPECKKDVPASSKAWVNDYYRNPYKKVCYDCYDKVWDEINEFRFDPSDAGEAMEEDY